MEESRKEDLKYAFVLAAMHLAVASLFLLLAAAQGVHYFNQARSYHLHAGGCSLTGCSMQYACLNDALANNTVCFRVLCAQSTCFQRRAFLKIGQKRERPRD